MDIKIRISDNYAIEGFNGFNFFVDMDNEDHPENSHGVGCVTREEVVNAIKAYLLQEAKH